MKARKIENYNLLFEKEEMEALQKTSNLLKSIYFNMDPILGQLEINTTNLDYHNYDAYFVEKALVVLEALADSERVAILSCDPDKEYKIEEVE